MYVYVYVYVGIPICINDLYVYVYVCVCMRVCMRMFMYYVYAISTHSTIDLRYMRGESIWGAFRIPDKLAIFAMPSDGIGWPSVGVRLGIP